MEDVRNSVAPDTDAHDTVSGGRVAVAEPEGEDPRGATPPKWDRTELLSTTVALLWVSIVALVDAVFGGKFGLIGFLAIGPFIAAAFAGVRRTALVGLYATFFSLILSAPPHQYGQFNHLLRVLTLVASSGVAVWIAYLRTQRSQQLRSARTETRNERRRRVAAETAQSMQALARALTTSADPAQVADAVFGALRDELHVDAAIFATTNDRGVLCVHRRFGYASEESAGALLAAMDPDGELREVLQRRAAFFAESVDNRRREFPRWPPPCATTGSTRSPWCPWSSPSMRSGLSWCSGSRAATFPRRTSAFCSPSPEPPLRQSSGLVSR